MTRPAATVDDRACSIVPVEQPWDRMLRLALRTVFPFSMGTTHGSVMLSNSTP